MSYYYRRRYYRSKNNEPEGLEMIFEVIFLLIVALGRLLGTLFFKIFKVIFDNRNKIKGLFKINNEPQIFPEAGVVVNNVGLNEQTEEESKLLKSDTKISNNKIDKYRLKESQITQSEENFLEVLRKVVGDRYRIEPQVQLSSIVVPTDSSANYTNYHDFNKIKAKSIDFVLFDDRHRPHIAIELDDRTHFRWNRMKRDEFVNDLMREVGLRLVRIPASYSYDPSDLERKIFNY